MKVLGVLLIIICLAYIGLALDNIKDALNEIADELRKRM